MSNLGGGLCCPEHVQRAEREAEANVNHGASTEGAEADQLGASTEKAPTQAKEADPVEIAAAAEAGGGAAEAGGGAAEAGAVRGALRAELDRLPPPGLPGAEIIFL
jgi:hypothetical protein